MGAPQTLTLLRRPQCPQSMPREQSDGILTLLSQNGWIMPTNTVTGMQKANKHLSPGA
jgi:hypothetical protein